MTKYFTMNEALVIYNRRFASPKSSSALIGLMRRRSDAYKLRCAPKKRHGMLTVTENQLNKFMENIAAHPPSKAHRRGVLKNYGKSRPSVLLNKTRDETPPPWDWKKNVRDAARRNWAAAQGEHYDR